MPDSSFARVRQQAGWSPSVLLVYIASLASVVLAMLLMIDLGFLIELISSRKMSGEWLPIAGPFLASLATGVFTFEAENAEIWLLILALPGVAIAVLLGGTLWAYYAAVNGAALDAATRLRHKVQQQAFRLGSSDLLGSPTSRPEELFGGQVQRVQEALGAWWLAVPRSYVALILLGLLALALNATITVVALCLSGLTFLFYRWLVVRAAASERLWQDRARQQFQMLLERLRLAQLVAGYALPQPPGEKFENDLARHSAADLEVQNSQAAIFPLTLLGVLVSTALLLLLIGFQSLQGQFSLPGAVVLGTTFLAAFFPIRRLMRLTETQGDAEQATEEIFAYLDREPSIVQATPAVTLGRLADQMALDTVRLVNRQGEVLLNSVAATLPAKRRSAILATDAQTPMALAGLLVRLYDPMAGRVLYDGKELTTASLESLRKQCLFVSADGPLFTGSVQDNITCGDERITSMAVTEAAKLAGAYDFVQQLPEGFATLVGPYALTLEPSQAFRIGLARAIVRGPSFVVVEEPDGPLDEASAAMLDAALHRITEKGTLVILPRRVETIRAADRVYLFHEGKLHAAGTHVELIEQSELYRHLIYLRFNALRDQVRA